MSCRVLKRGVEDAIISELKNLATQNTLGRISAKYIETAKNSMIKDLHASYGFSFSGNESKTEGNWSAQTEDITTKNHKITINIMT